MYHFYLTSEEPSLIRQLLDYFAEKYFSIDYGNYSHIELGTGLVNPGSMIVCLFIGIIIASIAALFSKRVLGDFVRAISRERALSPSTAMTLEQLGFGRNTAVRSALKRNGSLRRAVRCVEDDCADLAAGIPLRPGIAELYAVKQDPNAPTPGRTDLDQAHFYIPEAEIYTAEIRYEKKGTNPVSLLLTIVICVIACSLLFKLLPDILQLVDNFIGIVKPTGNMIQ